MKKYKNGSTPNKNGCMFVVWAPNADEVYIIGTFNNWDTTKNPMSKGSNGLWSINIPGAKIGDEYRYRIMTSGKEYLRIDPYTTHVTNSVGNAIITKPCHNPKTDNFTIPKLNELIIYELHIGTFGKKKEHSGPGTLEGAINRLPYLKELGINAVEVMPLAEFAGDYSWGYNPSHIFAVESEYGLPCTFRDFIREAHRLGIAVIVDVVYNHFGPSDLSLWQFDGWNENGKGGIYFYNDLRSQTPWGDTRPDYGRKEVRKFIRDNALMWIRDFDADGLRWDMTAFIRNVYGRNNDSSNDLADGWTLMQWINKEIKKVKHSAFTIAEDLQNNPFLTKTTEDNGAGFDAQWAAAFVHPIRKVLTAAEDKDRDMNSVHDAILHRYYLDAFERVVYTESHDEVANGKARVPEEVDPGKASSWAAKKKSLLGAALVFTVQGIPMIFQGQEFLEDDWFHDQDPIDWTKKERFSGILKAYQDLITLRLNHTGVSKGLCGQEVNVYHVNHKDKIIGYHRWAYDDLTSSVIIIINFSSKHYQNYWLGFPMAGEWFVRFNSDSYHYDKDFSNIGVSSVFVESKQKDNMPAEGNINIGPYSALILTPDNAGN